jgi:hypothetical protein
MDQGFALGCNATRPATGPGISIEHGEAETAGWRWRGSSIPTAWSSLAVG